MHLCSHVMLQLTAHLIEGEGWIGSAQPLPVFPLLLLMMQLHVPLELPYALQWHFHLPQTACHQRAYIGGIPGHAPTCTAL